MLRVLQSGYKSGLQLAAMAGLCVFVSGCKVGPNYQRPAMPAPPSFKENAPPPNPPNGGWTTAQPADQSLRGDWWTMYGDAQLNALEDKVAVNNQTIRAAMEQYLQARAQVATARASYYPTLSAGPSIGREKFSSNQPAAGPSDVNDYNNYLVEGQASWEPDFWGQLRRTVEAARANAQASAAQLANAELSVRTELALDYFELRGLDSDQQLLDSTVKSYEDYYNLTVSRYHGGVATDSDVALAETQLEQTRTQAVDIGVGRAQFEHAIATLIGEPASTFSLAQEPLKLALPAIPAGVPSQLLERRPDISTAERLTQAANEQIGIAQAAYYPTITLTGTGGFNSTTPGTWIQGPSALWSIGASAMETLFDAGRRRSLTAQARDAYEAQAANYRQSVLNGFQEVEDNLAALRLLDHEVVTQKAAVIAAQRSLRLSTDRYRGGVTTYLEVLTAQTADLTNERTATDITTRQFAASVQLIKALGGGWSTSQLPKP
jgi:NodT family efflux transporter outer membrane factor (OMF) lipoprotein